MTDRHDRMSIANRVAAVVIVLLVALGIWVVVDVRSSVEPVPPMPGCPAGMRGGYPPCD